MSPDPEPSWVPLGFASSYAPSAARKSWVGFSVQSLPGAGLASQLLCRELDLLRYQIVRSRGGTMPGLENLSKPCRARR